MDAIFPKYVHINENVKNDDEQCKVLSKKDLRKKYNSNFATNNKDKIKTHNTCNICYGTYTYYNKSTHNKSKRHQSALNFNK